MPWRCVDCSRQIFPVWAPRCRRRTCPGYAGLWAGDQRRKIFENLRAYTEGTGDVLLGAVTAPGAGELPWDVHHCSGLGEHEHSGLLGCRVEAGARHAYNRAAPDRWRRLHRRAYQEARRRGHRPWLIARVWEEQARGVLHAHPVLGYGSTADRLAARVYVGLLAELAPAYGFGYVERKIRPMASRAAAAYLSAYFVQGSGGKATLQESVRSTAMPRSIVHVSVRLTMATGCTMRSLRLRRYAWRCWTYCKVPEELRPLVQLGMRQMGVPLDMCCPPNGPPLARAA